MSTSLRVIQGATIVRSILSCVSLIASSFIMFMIKFEPKRGFKSPYSRIIFGLSASDVVFSLGMLLSPFLSPRDTVLRPAFSKGNTQSCEFAGYLFIMGMAAVPSYTLFLTYYFMRRVKYRVLQRVFALKEEKILHVIFITLIFLFPTIALVRKEINESNSVGTMCFIASSPHDCGRDGHPDDCVRGPNADIYAGIFGAFGGTVFICLLIVLGMFTHHVYSIEKHFASSTKKDTTKKEDSLKSDSKTKEHNFIKKRESRDENVDSNNAATQSQTSNQETESQESQKDNAENSSQNNEEEGQIQGNEESESNKEENEEKTSLARKALNQSLLYIAAFMLIYMPGMVQVIFKMARIDSVADSQIFLWSTSFLYPLGGVFNILIYTRPKVHKLLEQLPHMPYFIGLLIVILSGGEVPSMADLGIMRTPDSVTENFKDNNNADDEEEEEMRQQAMDQLEVNMEKISGLMRIFGLNSSDLSSFDSQDWKSSIGPSELHKDESNLNALSFDTTSKV
ncbi:hypothetical protein CTEN210_18551 [Chaetoceros tenuissimus]|uniref:G-protein coupled receptors family 1 profile domain-containing protein n=1 Tax=Chaetoceros tenuissimus TaxID=426638 RepID=A0AAD3HFT5_9STRA|nr:hypothetical protein CTEN210_18551 [Chaetoceros tenuissimus]